MEVKRMVCASYSRYRNHKLQWIFYEGLGPIIKVMILFFFVKTNVMMSDNRKCPSSNSINLHWTEEKQENQEFMGLFEWLFLLVYMKITPVPIFRIVFVSQKTNHPSMFYITWQPLLWEHSDDLECTENKRILSETSTQCERVCMVFHSYSKFEKVSPLFLVASIEMGSFQRWFTLVGSLLCT